MAPPVESAADGPEDVLDLTAPGGGRRTRTAAARDRLARAGAEAQAELAILRTGGAVNADRVASLQAEVDQLRLESRRSAGEADRLRDSVATLQRDQAATLALVEAARTELSVV